jgi:hypothetical protein
MIHIILPEQYLRRAGQHRIEPQKRLMLAVLQTVVDDCRGSSYRIAAGFRAPVDRRAYEQARAYVASRDRSWPFSFENLCEAVGLDADRLRAGLSLAEERE